MLPTAYRTTVAAYVCLCLKARRVCRLCCGTSDMNMGWTAHGSGGLRIRNLECMRLDEASEISFYTESRWPNTGEVDEVMSHASWTRHSRPFDARVQSRRCQLARGFYEQELAAWNFVHRDVDGSPVCHQGTSAGSTAVQTLRFVNWSQIWNLATRAVFLCVDK